MKFTQRVEEQFQKAGYNKQNNKLEQYQGIYKFDEFPKFLKDFLKKYGNTIVSDNKDYESEVTNILRITPDFAYFEYENNQNEDYDYYKNIIGKDIYPFAAYNPDGYRIACDEDGKVYMLGDYIFRIADDLKTGIEILVTDDTSKDYYQLDENTGEWVKNKRWDD